MIFSTQVFAGTSWFNKGSELLKSFGIGSQASELTIEEIAIRQNPAKRTTELLKKSIY